MLITWTLVLAVALQPYPTIALLKEFKTREACEKAIRTVVIEDECRARLACLPIAHNTI